MARTNRSRNETAFTVSIEAREGITTGISAADRARTIAVAIDAGQRRRTRWSRPAMSSRWSPGPAACWSAPAIPRPRSTSRGSPGSTRRGVICEIMREDGTMARLDDLMDFARDPRPQDRHHPRPHRLPAEEGPYGRAGRRDPLHRQQRRASGRRRCSATRRAARSSSRWSTAPLDTDQAGAGPDAQPRPVRRRARRSRAERSGLLDGAMAMIEAEGVGRHRRASRRRARIAVARRPTCARASRPRPARRCAATASARRSSPRSASTT